MTLDRTLVDVHVVSDPLIPPSFKDVEQDLALPRCRSLAAVLKLEAARPRPAILAVPGQRPFDRSDADLFCAVLIKKSSESRG